MAHDLSEERPVFLSSLPAGRREQRVAPAVVLVSVALFVAAAPFARLALAPVPAFIPIYESALVINDLVTAVMRGNSSTPAMIVVVSVVWPLSVVALALLSRRRPYSVLDLWLMVVMCAWMFDIALSAVLNAGRYDLGFYAGRIYGLMATSFVLVVLLLENSRLYARLIEAHASDRRKAAELQRLSVVDALTGIANRRAFDTALDLEWRRSLRHRTPLCLLMIDVDCFKRFNDAYGHVAGDQCLQLPSPQALARNARRAGEMAARYGGEEFAVLLPQTELADARRLAQRMCQAVRDLEHSPSRDRRRRRTSPSASGWRARCMLCVSDIRRSAAGHAEARTAAARRSRPDRARQDRRTRRSMRAKAAGRDRAVSARADDVGRDDYSLYVKTAHERPDATLSAGETVFRPKMRP